VRIGDDAQRRHRAVTPWCPEGCDPLDLFRASLGGGRGDGGWLAVLPPGHPALAAMGGLIQLDAAATVHVVQIRPEAVQELWAGLFLVHHLSHLADRVLGASPANPDAEQVLVGEERAYGLQYIAANLVSRGRLRPALDSLLNRWNPLSLDWLADRVARWERADLDRLNSSIPSGAPRSEAEWQLRADFFAVALLIRQAERRSLGPEAVVRALARLTGSADSR
jgi:hypothetical protein